VNTRGAKKHGFLTDDVVTFDEDADVVRLARIQPANTSPFSRRRSCFLITVLVPSLSSQMILFYPNERGKKISFCVKKGQFSAISSFVPALQAMAGVVDRVAVSYRDILEVVVHTVRLEINPSGRRCGFANQKHRYKIIVVLPSPENVRRTRALCVGKVAVLDEHVLCPYDRQALPVVAIYSNHEATG
jgi:hypothetical protein